MQIRFMTAVAAAVVMLGTASQAQAQVTRSSGSGFSPASVTALPVSGTDLVIDVAGIATNAVSGDPANTVLFFQLAPNALVDALAWNLTQTAFAPSWLSELTINFSNSAGIGAFVAPGVSQDAPGTGSFSGSASLVALNLDFNLGADGLLRVEFFEFFDDPEVTPDGRFLSGNVTLSNVVPEPATYGMMALGLLAVAAAARRRRS